MLNKRGMNTVRRTVAQIKRLADECEARLARTPADVDLARVAAEQRQAERDLTAAGATLLAALAAVKEARASLEEAYAGARGRYFRGKSWVYARFGHEAADELAAFGLRPPSEMRPRPRRPRPGVSYSPAAEIED